MADPVETVTAVEVLALKLLSPVYWAVIALAAIGRVVVNVALPAESVAVPIELPSLRNSTVPVGVPAPGLTTATVAVRVTDSPALGFVLETVRPVVVDACAIVTMFAVDVPLVKSVSPE